jgi:hypothetical protein
MCMCERDFEYVNTPVYMFTCVYSRECSEAVLSRMELEALVAARVEEYEVSVCVRV